FESRTSSFMTPLKPGTDDGLADPCCGGCWFEQPANPSASPKSSNPTHGLILEPLIMSILSMVTNSFCSVDVSNGNLSCPFRDRTRQTEPPPRRCIAVVPLFQGGTQGASKGGSPRSLMEGSCEKFGSGCHFTSVPLA